MRSSRSLRGSLVGMEVRGKDEVHKHAGKITKTASIGKDVVPEGGTPDRGASDFGGPEIRGGRRSQPLASICLRRLSGRMSVHTSLTYSRHSAFGPLLPASRHPAGFSRSAGQIEYCSS